MEEVFVPVTKSHHPRFEGLSRRLLTIFVVLNLLYLDILFLRSFSSPATVEDQAVVKPEAEVAGGGCDETCLDEVKKAVATFAASMVPNEEVVSFSTKEYYVPLGSGTSSANDWTDVVGASAYINTASYGKIKEVKFDASVSIPSSSQYAYIRLFNSTDLHPVWFSEVSTYESTKLLFSGPIQLDEGNKLYTVQIKTQLDKPVILDQARVKITTY